MWKRHIDLQIYNRDTGDVLLSTTENRIDFVYEGTMGWTSDRLKLDVYNLSPDTLKMLLNTKQRSIKVDVGYEDELSSLSTLLDGYVVNVAGRKAIPNHITSIWCVPYSAETLSSNSNLNVLDVSVGTLSNLLEAISASAGYKTKPKYFGIPSEVLETIVPSYVFRGTVTDALNELGGQYSFSTRPTNSRLEFVATVGASANVIQQIAAGLSGLHIIALDKLKGTPEATVAHINFVVNLDAAIDCGDVVDVTAFLGARISETKRVVADGVISVNNLDSAMFRSDTLWEHTINEQYQVLQLQHVGSNFAPAWETRITGVTFNEGYVGSSEVSGNGQGPGTWHVDVSAEVERTQGVPHIDQNVSTVSSKEAKALGMVQLSKDQVEGIASVSNGDRDKEKFLQDKLIIENRGHTSVQDATSNKAAVGPYQFTEDTGRSLGLTINKNQDDRHDFKKSTAAAGKYYDDLNRRYKGNLDAMNADYNGGPKQGVPVANGQEAPSKETQDYIRMDRALQ